MYVAVAAIFLLKTRKLRLIFSVFVCAVVVVVAAAVVGGGGHN